MNKSDTVLTRAVPLTTVFIVAIGAFTLSFVAIKEVAASTGAVSPGLSWMVPVVIDGIVIAGCANIWATARRGTPMEVPAVLTVGLGLALSLVVNAAHAGPSPLAKVLATFPPIGLFLTLELAASALRKSSPIPAKKSPRPRPQTARAEGAPQPGVSSPAARPAAPVRENVTKSSKHSDSLAADKVLEDFNAHVSAGGDPLDPSLAKTIARTHEVTPQYVRKVLKPVKENARKAA